MPKSVDGTEAAAREAALLQIARDHNADAARRATERRVQRIKCLGCGELCEDSAAFQVAYGQPSWLHAYNRPHAKLGNLSAPGSGVLAAPSCVAPAPRLPRRFYMAATSHLQHRPNVAAPSLYGRTRPNMDAPALIWQVHCGVVEHDDDFSYECETVEVVISADEALPEGSTDLNAPDVHAFYNAHAGKEPSLSIADTSAPFELDGESFVSIEDYWRSDRVREAEIDSRCPPQRSHRPSPSPPTPSPTPKKTSHFPAPLLSPLAGHKPHHPSPPKPHQPSLVEPTANPDSTKGSSAA